MFTKTLIAVAAVATLASAASAPANAKTNLDVYLGIGGFGPGYYEPSYPVYDEPRYEPRRPRYHAPRYERYGVSCDEGADIVRESGFRKVRALNCSGKRYKYQARRDGDTYIVKVSRNGGNVISVEPRY